MLSIPKISNECCQISLIAFVNVTNLQAIARRIHDKNATQIKIQSANMTRATNIARSVELADSAAKNTAPIAATPAAFAICAVVPYIPEPEPADRGFTVESTTLDSGAITRPWPKPKMARTNESGNAVGARTVSSAPAPQGLSQVSIHHWRQRAEAIRIARDDDLAS